MYIRSRYLEERLPFVVPQFGIVRRRLLFARRMARSRARQASPELLREPVGDHLYHVGPHYRRRRELRIVVREAVGAVHEQMVEVRQHVSDEMVEGLGDKEPGTYSRNTSLEYLRPRSIDLTLQAATRLLESA